MGGGPWDWKIRIWNIGSVPTKLIFFSQSAICWNKYISFWQNDKHSIRKFDKFVEIWHVVYFNTELVQNLRHINVFLELWAHLFLENLGTGRLAKKIEKTLRCIGC